jgi:hypothetical protein
VPSEADRTPSAAKGWRWHVWNIVGWLLHPKTWREKRVTYRG